MTDNSIKKRITSISARIKEEREKIPNLSQTKLGEKIGELLPNGEEKVKDISQGTVSDWENGKSFPQLDKIVAMAKIFKCDIAYLLCDYNERVRDASDICSATGLTEKALQNIMTLNRFNDTDWIMDVFNAVLESEDFLLLALLMTEYASANETIEVIGKGYFHSKEMNSCDISAAQIQRLLFKILDGIRENFEKRPDKRGYYIILHGLAREGKITDDELKTSIEKLNNNDFSDFGQGAQ